MDISEADAEDYRRQDREDKGIAHLEERRRREPPIGEPCEKCGGEGKVKSQAMRPVTRDMAIDAGDPALEGSPLFQIVEEECPRCHGEGVEP